MRCAACSTTSTPTSPRTRRRSSSTAAAAVRRAARRRSQASSRRSSGSAPTRRSSSSPARRWRCCRRTRTRPASSSRPRWSSRPGPTRTRSAALEDAGLTMYGQMTAAGWFYIGTQGILGFTYETFRAVADAHFGGTLAGRRVLTAGLGGMGGAQGFGVTLNGGRALVVEVDPARAERRLRDGWVDVVAGYERGLRRTPRSGGPGRGRARRQRGRGRPAAPRRRRRLRRRHRPDAGARSARGRTCHVGSTAAEAAGADAGDSGFRARSSTRSPTHVRALARLPGARARSSSSTETASGRRPRRTVWRTRCRDPGLRRRVRAADLRARCRPVPLDRLSRRSRPICGGARTSSWRWSGTDSLRAWIELARERVCRTRACPPGSAGSAWGERDEVAVALNELVRSGRVRAARARPRPHGSRLGRLADPRDRGDARRERRDRGLAGPLGAAQRRAGRELGRDRQRRWCRRRPLDPLAAWSSSRTAASSPSASFGACSGPTRRSASRATPTPAIRRRATRPLATGWTSRVELSSRALATSGRACRDAAPRGDGRAHGDTEAHALSLDLGRPRRGAVRADHGAPRVLPPRGRALDPASACA